MNEAQPDSSIAPSPEPAIPLGHAGHVVETVQTVLTALMLAFVFRAFLVEAFIIPTGSMAPALLGAHATVTCPGCGWEFDVVPANRTVCPNCHLNAPCPAGAVPEKAGDRILVHKWPFLMGGLLGPQRWDVIVFRNPSDHSENYIKRVVGRPGEEVEIIDGDVYIDGLIQRKTRAAQSVLWSLVFDQDYLDAPNPAGAEPTRWRADSHQAAAGAGGWSGLDQRVLRFEPGEVTSDSDTLRFSPGDARYYQDVYGYNRGPSEPPTPLVGDVRLSAEVRFGVGDGLLRCTIERDGVEFHATLHRDGRLELTRCAAGGAALEVLATARYEPLAAGRPYALRFQHLDYRVSLELDGAEVLATRPTQHAPDLAALREWNRTEPVRLAILAQNAPLELRSLRVERDVYYTYREHATRRAYPHAAFRLEPGEYFVLGDNSPDSRDSREWTERGVHLPPDYRVGTVRAEQIVGLAAFVYLPGLAAVDPAGAWKLPDVGRMRFIR